MHEPPAGLREWAEQALGRRWVQWTRPDCGLSAAHRFAVVLDDGSSVFVKAATDAPTEHWLRTEHLVLTAITRSGLAPEAIAWLEAPGARPVLISEDLSEAYWPASHAGVSWREGDFDPLFAGIEAIGCLDAPAGLAPLTNRNEPVWAAIGREPVAFLALGLCSAGWLAQHVGALAEAEMAADITGDALVHGDIRSDNVCLHDGRAVFVDWSSAGRGSAVYNLAMVLPALHLEGGPSPFEVMTDGGPWAAMQSADLARRMTNDDRAPAWLKRVLARLIAIDLEWAASSLGLAAPDGAGWREI